MKTAVPLNIDEKISLPKSLSLGAQHVLAMDLYIVPIILAGLLSLSVGDTSSLIQMTFIVAGLCTIIQSGFLLKLPVMQGPSYIPIGAIAAIGKSMGMGAVYGAMIPVAICVALLGRPLNLFSRLVKTFVPPIVGGTVIIVVGISLLPVAFNGIYTADHPAENILIAMASMFSLSAFILLGCFIKQLHWLRLASVLGAIVVGTLVAASMGMADFSAVSHAAWIELPSLLPFGELVFDPIAILTLLFVTMIVLVETTGTWCAVTAVTGTELDDNRLNRGATGEAAGQFICSLLGGSPVTGYSTNAGIIAVTGVASRRAIIAGGFILLVLGLVPKLTSLIASVPHAVIAGIFAVICVVIAMNGFRVVQNIHLTERNMLVIGLPIMLALGAVLMPREIIYALPELVGYLANSGIAIGALAAVILNFVLPNEAPLEAEA
ncbi:xanthine/uracil permease [Enterovibrio norvegicus FF-33]|uniref:Xanthine/uracil permease n=1 Tax=Enterovibrio norvegicus FF-454 TaxID=1185651 RepID=A0A1E5BYJ2_9GAMM|nr:solute carrier family 23 protein [Enterovibrio norvegicus]OEE58269.1 xanthine/uracil permease [Enterovibrio norvegicus FF-454]OEE67181.1 xanthine/uracil permease [Enterovibrio norvegicus FF-33]OEE87063.1 xanthine/uracil permease [Enterovibrio norvegicus FF-162]